MTTIMAPADASYESLSQRHRDDLAARLPAFLARSLWSAQRIAAERQESLRRLLAHAKRQSPWHARRLAHINPETFEESDLARLPRMTKADVMANFDEIVTDPRLTLAAAEMHLSQLEESPACNSYLLDQFHVIATSGSSGRRGVFVYDWDGWTVAAMSVVRNRAIVDREIAERPPDYKAVMIGAGNASHLSYALTRTFFPEATLIPVTLPLAEIVARVNSLQPNRIAGYPSMLHQLCLAADRGELHIAPIAITSSAEPLFPEIHAALERTFVAKVFDVWGCSEAAMLGFSCPKGRGLHLYDDLAIIEPVDAQNNVVTEDAPSSKILVTNLFNMLMPLIRYEISDSVTLLDSSVPCSCGSHFRKIASVHGRSDDSFTYASGVFVHPTTFDSMIRQEPAIVEYQVRQTPRGVCILANAAHAFDHESFAAQIEAALSRIGLSEPEVIIEFAPQIARGLTGKLVQFVPLRAR
jgi:phenylacetate-CoA ligase